LKHNAGSLNRIDRLTASNYSLPINQNSCENIFVNIDGKAIMLQAVSIYTKPTEWTIEEMLPIMMEVSKTSLRIIGVMKEKTKK
jgi:type II restriction enzyme